MSTAQFPKLTYTDLERLPPSRNLYHELFDGELVTHDARTERRPVSRLWGFLIELGLYDQAPMVSARPEWYVDEHNVFRPDVLYRADLVAYHLGHRHERGPVKRDWPVLLIDMLEPPTDAPDRRRLDAYARTGTPYYWVVDPQVPSVTLLELVSGVFMETAVVRGYDVLAVDDPFPIKLCPGDQMV